MIDKGLQWIETLTGNGTTAQLAADKDFAVAFFLKIEENVRSDCDTRNAILTCLSLS